jgi:hypothetical protein
MKYKLIGGPFDGEEVDIAPRADGAPMAAIELMRQQPRPIYPDPTRQLRRDDHKMYSYFYNYSYTRKTYIFGGPR